MAQKLSQMGFKVYATVLSTTSEGAQELISNPLFENKIIVLQMDVTKDSDVSDVYHQIKNDLEKSGDVLWAVVNNAGILTCAPLEWGSFHRNRQLFEVNVFGTVRVTRVFLPLIRESKGNIQMYIIKIIF